MDFMTTYLKLQRTANYEDRKKKASKTARETEASKAVSASSVKVNKDPSQKNRSSPQDKRAENEKALGVTKDASPEAVANRTTENEKALGVAKDASTEAVANRMTESEKIPSSDEDDDVIVLDQPSTNYGNEKTSLRSCLKSKKSPDDNLQSGDTPESPKKKSTEKSAPEGNLDQSKKTDVESGSKARKETKEDEQTGQKHYFVEQSYSIDAFGPDRSKSDYYCEICDSHMNTLQMWENHIGGKRHLKNSKKKPEDQLSKFKWIVKKNAIPLIQEEMDQVTESVVGLSFMSEHQRTNKAPQYSCFLCGGHMVASLALEHVKSARHRLNFFKEVDPEGALLFENVQLKKEFKENLLANKALEWEAKHGRGNMEVKEENKKCGPMPPNPKKAKKKNHDISTSEMKSGQKRDRISPSRWRNRDSESPRRDRFSPDFKHDRSSSRHKRFSPARDRFSPKRDRFSRKQDRYSPKRDRFSPKRDRYSPKRDRFSPKRVHFSPARDRISSRRDRSSPERDRHYFRRDDSSPIRKRYSPRRSPSQESVKKAKKRSRRSPSPKRVHEDRSTDVYSKQVSHSGPRRESQEVEEEKLNLIRTEIVELKRKGDTEMKIRLLEELSSPKITSEKEAKVIKHVINILSDCLAYYRLRCLPKDLQAAVAKDVVLNNLTPSQSEICIPVTTSSSVGVVSQNVQVLDSLLSGISSISNLQSILETVRNEEVSRCHSSSALKTTSATMVSPLVRNSTVIGSSLYHNPVLTNAVGSRMYPEVTGNASLMTSSGMTGNNVNYAMPTNSVVQNMRVPLMMASAMTVPFGNSTMPPNSSAQNMGAGLSINSLAQNSRASLMASDMMTGNNVNYAMPTNSVVQNIHAPLMMASAMTVPFGNSTMRPNSSAQNMGAGLSMNSLAQNSRASLMASDMNIPFLSNANSAGPMNSINQNSIYSNRSMQSALSNSLFGDLSFLQQKLVSSDSLKRFAESYNNRRPP